MQADDALIEEVDEHIAGVLDAAYRKMGCVAPTRNGRPVVQMVDSYRRQEGGEDFEIWLEAWRGFMDILWQEGPSPEKALKRLIALTWAVSRDHLANMTMHQLAELTEETPAAWSNRVKIVYSDYLKSRGFRGTRVPGQKTEGATKVYAQVSKKNVNRKSGRKKGDIARPPKQRKQRQANS